MTIVEVKGYGDFDMMYTHSVWVSDGDCALPTGDYKNERKPDKLIQELKSLGFKQAKTKSVVFGGNL